MKKQKPSVGRYFTVYYCNVGYYLELKVSAVMEN